MTESYGYYCPTCHARYRTSVCSWENKENGKSVLHCPNGHVLAIKYDGEPPAYEKFPIYIYKKNYPQLTEIRISVGSYSVSFSIDYRKLRRNRYNDRDLAEAIKNAIIHDSSLKFPKRQKSD